MSCRDTSQSENLCNAWGELMSSERPDLEVIEKLFQRHLNIHGQAHDTARIRDLGADEALIRDYSGRVVFELLQNALDRALERILIWLLPSDDGSRAMLIVGNDGHPVRVDKRDSSDSGLRR